MAKTSDKSFYYFEHRTGSRNDIKLLTLDDALGDHIGYALYFKCLEVMLENDSPYIAYNSRLVAKAIGITVNEYNTFIDAAISCGLFVSNDEGLVFSPPFVRWIGIKQCRSDAGKKGGLISKRPSTSEANDKANVQADAKQMLNIDKADDSAQAAEIPKPAKKSKAPDITGEIVSHWNSLADKNKCQKITSDVQKAVEKRAKEYTSDEIKSTISNYLKTVQADETKFTYRWSLIDFLNRANGFPVFYGEEADIMSRYGCKVQEPQPPQTWSHPFPKPENWDEMTIDQRREYVKEMRK